MGSRGRAVGNLGAGRRGGPGGGGRGGPAHRLSVLQELLLQQELPVAVDLQDLPQSLLGRGHAFL